MRIEDLNDYQWCVLDLLMRARAKGVERINKSELLNGTGVPQTALVRLTWAAMTMPPGLVEWHEGFRSEFSITPEGVSLFNLKFGGRDGSPAEPTEIAESVIALPGPGGYAS